MTLNLSNEAMSLIRIHAKARKISLGAAASELVVRGSQSLHFKMKDGWVIFELPRETQPLTNEILEAWEDEDYEEEHRRAFFKPPAKNKTSGPTESGRDDR